MQCTGSVASAFLDWLSCDVKLAILDLACSFTFNSSAFTFCNNAVTIAIIVIQYLSSYHFNHTAKTDRHTRLTASYPGTSEWAGTRKIKPFWILMMQQMMGDSGISWTICKSFAPCFRQITRSSRNFLQAGCSSWCLTNCVKAVKANNHTTKK